MDIQKQIHSDYLIKQFINMRQTSTVMFERSQWYGPIYQSLVDDSFSTLCQSRSELKGKEKLVAEPVRYALGYAQIVSLGTAIELTLLHLYTNSILNYRALISEDLSRLPNLPINPVNLSPEKLLEGLKKLSFSNMKEAQKKFSDIYGTRCFQTAWNTQVYNEIVKQVELLQKRRNDIVHRGGESVNGKPVEVSKAEVQKAFSSTQKLKSQFATLSDWCLSWWLKKINQGSTA